MSGFAERFTVQDSECGFLEAFSTLWQAKEYATRVRERYTYLTIFDRMARKGVAQLWAWKDNSGWNCKSNRPKQEPAKPLPLGGVSFDTGMIMRDNPDRDRYDYDNRPPIGAETMYESGYWQ